jgi:hypothetical protein
MREDRALQEKTMARLKLRPRIRKLTGQICAAYQVGKQEGDNTFGKQSHSGNDLIQTLLSSRQWSC